MRRPFPACSQEPSHGSGPVPESLRPVAIQSSVSGMHRTLRARRHESFRSVLLWFRVRATACSGAARNVHPACSWICPCILDAAKRLVVSVKRGAESAALCGACQTSRSDRAGLVDVVLMNGRVIAHAFDDGLERRETANIAPNGSERRCISIEAGVFDDIVVDINQVRIPAAALLGWRAVQLHLRRGAVDFNIFLPLSLSVLPFRLPMYMGWA
ncbi:hypothetical protein BKA58DRAFT_397540 [Alternaria rosae]|uniref:uncharacterized protein n=1 Tax=Alternaria rosae TaxID=1187941 RepID=UPI001E8EABD7|nr:uncharacterized protein BKA58DRAFT_397540 [Alternaria rosae]KAH6883341.1 hypothetical protein BKA58DRAFT_397540 [Alternaria rosae]